jgi:transcription-repair coupling factor (superfamily II helicase)
MITIEKSKQPIAHPTVIKQLIEMDYHRVEMVLEWGDIAVRGSIIDVFGYTHSHPTRIDYFGDAIDRLNSFDVHTQRSLTALTTLTFHPKPHNFDTPFYSFKQGHCNDNHNNDSHISTFQIDDYVVHEQFGIGYFKGLTRLAYQNQDHDLDDEFVQINYKGTDRLYVPLDQLHLIHAYSGPDSPTVTRLHDTTWKNIKKKASKTTKNIAEELYLLHQIRQMKPGFSFMEDTEAQIELESDFEYLLTPDQHTAMETIKSHMEAPHPMDLLLCGDVGFGKTEIILRAAFKALENIKQVALLVPTTILCAQHVKTITHRLEKYGYIVGELSRFKSKSEQRTLIQKLKRHQVDIVVGTHRLLSSDIKFKNLGLLIIDEEQRFGVSHKELIKTKYPQVDIITVSATPIPRTLYMSLTGAKSCVQINTPPPNRRPIYTHVGPYHDAIVKRAITEELNRGGQVYYLYNRVQTINRKLKSLQQLLPHYRIKVAHGQLSQQTLQTIMRQFYQREIDILLCSTIIENGMDISSVNTIIIDHANQLGVSQIHQLRGRVGRSTVQGYAYLLYDDTTPLSEVSQKRLQKIKEYTALGSGYQLAKSDLAHRGAGELFGREQSGHIHAVGFTLYCKLLEESINRVQGKSEPTTDLVPLNPKNIIISDRYISNPRERLALYMTLIELKSRKALTELEADIIDRYGPIDKTMKKVLTYVKRQLSLISVPSQ